MQHLRYVAGIKEFEREIPHNSRQPKVNPFRIAQGVEACESYYEPVVKNILSIVRVSYIAADESEHTGRKTGVEEAHSFPAASSAFLHQHGVPYV